MLENLKTHNPSSGGGDVLWPSLISYHTVNHPGCQPLPKLKRVTTMALPLEAENCNENQTTLNLSQSSSSMAVHSNLAWVQSDLAWVTSCGFNLI